MAVMAGIAEVKISRNSADHHHRQRVEEEIDIHRCALLRRWQKLPQPAVRVLRCGI